MTAREVARWVVINAWRHPSGIFNTGSAYDRRIRDRSGREDIFRAYDAPKIARRLLTLPAFSRDDLPATGGKE